MFKRRLTQSIGCLIAGLGGALTGIGAAIAICFLLKVPIIGVILKVVLVGAGLVVIGALVIEFVNWLIVEPYHNHKRKRETEGSAE
ncbi:hypothetical protein [Bacillus atrophaeus]|uniref:hypothetical protein n=1 Tax=Bacillus atrophaeus TaxID=1452 RepID=UPI001C639E57|nr:hypothetical protein [Bacillus atrophaeus]QYG88313.1 hypothetical protein HCU65_07400 [Bacillus atrophaeus]